MWYEVRKHMKQQHSKIGEYGIRWQPVEGYKRKDGKKVPPHLKKVVFRWNTH
jgi:hypothetical protein